MKYRIYIVAVVVLLIVSGLYAGYRGLRLPFLSIDPIGAVPATVSFFLETNYLEWNKLPAGIRQVTGILSGPEEDLAVYQDLLAELDTGWAPIDLCLVFQNTTPGKWGVAGILDARQSALPPGTLREMIEAKTTSTSFFQGVAVHHVKTQGGQIVVVARYRNLVIFGRMASQVEECIATLENPQNNLWEIQAFRRVYQRSGEDTVLNLYLNPRYQSELWESLLTAKVKPLAPTPNPTSWLRLTLHAGDSIIPISGEFIAVPASPLAALPDASAAPWQKNMQVLPAGIAYLEAFAPPDLEEYLDALGNEGHNAFEEYILPWMDSGLAYGLLEPHGGDMASSQFWLLQSKDPEKTRDRLEQLAAENGLLENTTYQTYGLYRLLADDLFAALGQAKLPFRNPWYCQIDRHVIFSTSRATLETWIDQYLVGNTFNKTASLSPAEMEASAFRYLDADKMRNWVAGAFKRQEAVPALTTLGVLKLAFDRRNQQVSFRGELRPGAQPAAGNSMVWKKQLAGKVPSSPKLVTTLDGQRYFAVQDEYHTLYCWDLQGNLIWKKHLNNPILSDIFVVAEVTSPAGHLLFNTREAVYRIGMDGEDANDFPLQLGAGAATGLTLVRFATDNQDAFFISSEGGSVYGYDVRGQPFTAWNPLQGAGYVDHPLLHTLVDNKDYFFTLNRDSIFMAFGRNGKARIRPVLLNGGPFYDPLLQEPPGPQRVVVGDANGRVHVITPVGEYFKLQLEIGNNQSVRFAYADITGDERRDYVVSAGDEVALYFYEGQKLVKKYNRRLPGKVGALFPLEQENGKAAIGAHSPGKRQIYLLDENGQLCSGFPLAGATPFVMAPLSDKGRLLATGYEDWLYVYGIRQ